MDIFTILIIGHLVGAVLGVGGATMIEVHINKALADGVMSPDEHFMMASTYSVVRWGLILGILTGFGFLLYYKFTGQTYRLYDDVLWAKIFIVLAIAANALLLQARKISLYWGSALSFVSWWTAFTLGVFLTRGVSYNFFAIMGTYIVVVVVGAAVLHYFRSKITKSS